MHSRAALLAIDPLALAESLRPGLEDVLGRLLEALGWDGHTSETLRPELPSRLQALHRWALWGYGADPVMDHPEARTAALSWARQLALTLVTHGLILGTSAPAHQLLAIVEAAGMRHRLTMPDEEVMLADVAHAGGLTGRALGDVMRQPDPALHAHRAGPVWVLRARDAVRWLAEQPGTGHWSPVDPATS